MKSILVALSLVTLAAGSAAAAPGHHGHRHGVGNVNGFERVAIARSAAQLAGMRKRFWADGRLTPFERFQIRRAEARHFALIARARRG